MEAKDWEDGENGSGFDDFAPNVKHALDHSLQIRSSWLDVPLSAKDIFIVTNGKNSGNAVVMDVSGTDSNGLRVQLVKQDKSQTSLSNSTVCLLTRGEGSYGFGILVSSFLHSLSRATDLLSAHRSTPSMIQKTTVLW